jgi:hypothetical protein
MMAAGLSQYGGGDGSIATFVHSTPFAWDMEIHRDSVNLVMTLQCTHSTVDDDSLDNSIIGEKMDCAGWSDLDELESGCEVKNSTSPMHPLC